MLSLNLNLYLRSSFLEQWHSSLISYIYSITKTSSQNTVYLYSHWSCYIILSLFSALHRCTGILKSSLCMLLCSIQEPIHTQQKKMRKNVTFTWIQLVTTLSLPIECVNRHITWWVGGSTLRFFFWFCLLVLGYTVRASCHLQKVQLSSCCCSWHTNLAPMVDQYMTGTKFFAKYKPLYLQGEICASTHTTYR